MAYCHAHTSIIGTDHPSGQPIAHDNQYVKANTIVGSVESKGYTRETNAVVQPEYSDQSRYATAQ